MDDWGLTVFQAQVETPSQTASRRLDSIDGLRAIAVLLVLLVHLTPGHDSAQGLKSIVFKLADIGWSGVDLFFVLSGFLITRILLRARERETPLHVFFMRRVLRIFPAYYASLMVVFWLVPVGTSLYGAPPLSRQLPYWAYVSNVMRTADPAGQWFDLSHFWSLALEMQFYAMWPFIVARRSHRAIAAIGCGALVAAFAGRAVCTWLDVSAWVTFAWLPLRADGLVVGSLLGLADHLHIQSRRATAVVVLCALFGAAAMTATAWFGYASAAMWRGRDDGGVYVMLRISLPLVLSVFYGALLRLGLDYQPLARLLSCDAFKPVARYSYGTYIIHNLGRPWFERVAGPNVISKWVGSGDMAIYIYFVLAASASIAMAAILYHSVEERFLRMKVGFE